MFCTFCGAAIQDGQIFCNKCGNKIMGVPGGEYKTPIRPSLFDFIIQREDQFYLLQPKTKIYIDSVDQYSQIGNGENMKFSLTPGQHNIVLKCAFRVTDFDIDIQRNTTISFKFNRITGKIDVTFYGAQHFIKKHS